MPEALPPVQEIPRKRYFAIGEVSDLCGIKPHVLRYWEQEFPQLKPTKRAGNRRYYQYDDVEMVRRIRSLLYEQGFTIGGARLRLKEQRQAMKFMEAANTPMEPVAKPQRQTELKTIRSELEDLLSRWPV